MKNLSLKLEDGIYLETERITDQMGIARNRYINEAVNWYNLFHRRRMLKSQLLKESGLTAADSLAVLKEMEKMIDGN